MSTKAKSSNTATPHPDSDHWLVRPSTVRLLWIVFSILLALSVLADFFVEHHSKFSIEGTFGFAAWYGLVTCIAMVLFAKLLGIFLKRRDTYYDD